MRTLFLGAVWIVVGTGPVWGQGTNLPAPTNSDVTDVASVPDGSVVVPDPEGYLPDAVEVLAPAPTVRAAPPKPPKLWEGSFELGLDGAEGNTETFNLRFGAYGKRKVANRVLTLDLDYHRGSISTLPTAHRLFFDGRHEWLFENSPWTYFIHGTAEYDEFRAFDARLAVDTGLGYRFIDTERTKLLGRIGAGVSHDLGVLPEEYVPELVFGLDFEHSLNDRHKLVMTADYMPAVTDFRDYRLVNTAGWESVIDEEMNLSLKLAARSQYDSTPHGAKPRDLDYSVMVLWKF